MQNDIFLSLVCLGIMSYIFSRIANIASASREKQLVREKKKTKDKKIDSLYGR